MLRHQCQHAAAMALKDSSDLSRFPPSDVCTLTRGDNWTSQLTSINSPQAPSHRSVSSASPVKSGTRYMSWSYCTRSRSNLGIIFKHIPHLVFCAPIGLSIAKPARSSTARTYSILPKPIPIVSCRFLDRLEAPMQAIFVTFLLTSRPFSTRIRERLHSRKTSLECLSLFSTNVLT